MAGKKEEYDVVVIGAGLAGQALALALAGQQTRPQLSVALLDARVLSDHVAPSFDGRATALAPASRNMLEIFGAWREIEPDVQPIERMKITDSRLDARTRPDILQFDPGRERGGALAYMAENRILNKSLISLIENTEAIELFAPAAFERMNARDNGVEIVTADGHRLTARLVVAADGRASPVRAAAGLTTVGWDYPQTGIVATVGHEEPHHGTATQHFLPSGPFAMLPLSGRRTSLVWTERSDRARALMAAPDGQFSHELAIRFGDHLGKIEVLGPRWSYPLTMHLAARYTAERVALVGDAAHVVHPIAGLGLNLGLRDVAALSELVVGAVRLGLDPGGAMVLEQYQQWRRFDNAAVALACDALNRMFSTEVPAIAAARQTGVRLVNTLGPLKRFFAGEASGARDGAPKLLRGMRI